MRIDLCDSAHTTAHTAADGGPWASALRGRHDHQGATGIASGASAACGTGAAGSPGITGGTVAMMATLALSRIACCNRLATGESVFMRASMGLLRAALSALSHIAAWYVRYVSDRTDAHSSASQDDPIHSNKDAP